MMITDIFVGISPDVDMPTSLFTYGVLVSKKMVNDKYLFILGIDSHTQLGGLTDGYDLFLVTKLSEKQIYNIAGCLGIDNKAWNKISQDNLNLGSLLYKIFKHSGLDRIELANKFFGIKAFEDYRSKLKPLNDVLNMFNK